MNRPSKLLQAFTAVGIAAGVTLGGVEVAAATPDKAFGSRFKPPGDHTRIGLFGLPGKPVSGPPGQYEG